MTTQQNRPQPNPGILDIAAYVPGKSAGPEGVKVHKLSANETPLGPSPKAKDAFSALASNLEDYPDGSASDLREALGKAHGLNPANILTGNGSDELLMLLAQCFLTAGDEAKFMAWQHFVWDGCMALNTLLMR